MSQHLTLILEGLRKAAAARASKNWSFSPVVLILWNYISRVMARFDSLSVRSLKGGAARQPPAPRVRVVPGALDKSDKADAPGKPDKADKPPKPRLPRTRGWLAAMGQDVAGYGSQLRYLLCDPRMQALMAASPGVGRLLRPLCRMLAIAPSPELPPSLYPVRPAKPNPTPKPAPKARPVRAMPAAPRTGSARPRPRVDPAGWWMPKRA